MTQTATSTIETNIIAETDTHFRFWIGLTVGVLGACAGGCIGFIESRSIGIAIAGAALGLIVGAAIGYIPSRTCDGLGMIPTFDGEAYECGL